MFTPIDPVDSLRDASKSLLGVSRARRPVENAPTDAVAVRLGLVGCSVAHCEILRRLRSVASTGAEILISGPSGVGKELYARFTHACSNRCPKAFIAVNCGAFPDGLFENEMFGHVGGAFTGARGQAEGLVAAAEGGTLFLDEVGELRLSAQVKLLRLLQEKEYRRLGETRLRRADVRFLSATNTPLLDAVRSGRFREDLFFRLRVVPIEIPSLRDRPDDIAAFLAEFIHKYAQSYALPPLVLSAAALRRLVSYHWPGNVRELENCVRCLTCEQLGRPAEPTDLPLLDPPASEDNAGCLSVEMFRRPFQQAKRDLVTNFERQYIESALRRADGNIARAAKLAGKHRRAFFELMRKHRIEARSTLDPPAVNHGPGIADSSDDA